MGKLCAVFALCLIAPGLASAALVPGLISDFEDGTVQGWTSNRNNSTNGGSFLVVSPAPRLAIHNVGINGAIDPLVAAISVDLRRPTGDTDLEMRLVLMHGLGGSTRWTSTEAQILPADGLFHTFIFSILEADLTRFGATSYADLTMNLDRVMIRYDPGAPDAGGSIGFGTFEMDNVIAVPEPAALGLLGIGLGLACALRRSPR